MSDQQPPQAGSGLAGAEHGQRDPKASASYVHHTDRRSQYGAKDLRKHGFKVSMSGKGNCYDTSAVENIFKSLKAGRVCRRNWQTRPKVEIAPYNLYRYHARICKLTSVAVSLGPDETIPAEGGPIKHTAIQNIGLNQRRQAA